MPYVTSIERNAFKRGFYAGWKEGFRLGLFEAATIVIEVKFDADREELVAQIREWDADQLRRLIIALARAESLDDVKPLLKLSVPDSESQATGGISAVIHSRSRPVPKAAGGDI